MKRIIMHWSAGSHTASNLDMEHYHFIVQGDGSVVVGKYTVADNESASDGKYAAHTKDCNTGSIGIAMAAMAGAVESPFHAGAFPITPVQLEAFTKLAARLARDYNIPITPTTILSHAEVQPTLGIKQNGKWDIAWLPGMAKPADPVTVGGALRSMIFDAQKPAPMVAPPGPSAAPPSVAKPGALAAFITAIAALFRKG